MKKKILTLLSLILILVVVVQTNGLGLFEKKTAYAVGDLNVIWGVPDGDPIFVVSNMLPGDDEDRDVDVANGGTVPRDVGVRGVKTEEIASFAGVLDFVISEGGNDLYGGTSPTGPKTIQEFFDESGGPNGLFLSNVGNGDTTTYNFLATFPSSSGNEYQNAKVVFDLQIGISFELPAECENINFGSNSPIFGTSGNDRINGTSGNDLIFAFEGNDKVFSHGGKDCIVGGPGNDELRGETGDDIIFGSEGNDIVLGAVGEDLLFGGAGNDTVKGENNDDVMFGNEGNDIMKGGNGDDVINGNEGDDNINGENGSDQVLGSQDNDTLFGGNGPDTLIGNDGTDSANGQNGTDTCDAETEVNCEL